MQVRGATVLVTGANRGVGKAFVAELVRRGAKTVYAGARDPETVQAQPGVVPVALDVTDPAQVAALAERLTDVDVVINNAGAAGGAPFLTATDLTTARQEIEVNYFGPLVLTRAFAPVLAANGGGAVLNVLSVLSFVTFPQHGSYSASKSAAWALTNALRIELAGQGTQVTALHMGYVDTDMTAGIDGPKAEAGDIVTAALDGLEDGAAEVLADDLSRQVKATLADDQAVLYPGIAAQWAAAAS